MTPDKIQAHAQRWASQFAHRVPLARHLLDELVQEAAIGILTAIKKFKPSKGAALETYAYMWAHARMQRHTNALSGAVSTASNVAARARCVAFRAPGSDSEDAPYSHEDDRTDAPTQEDTVAFNQALSRVDPRTYVVVTRRLQGYDLAEIGNEMGLSREWVRLRLAEFQETLTPAGW